jgi:thioredoxin reductase
LVRSHLVNWLREQGTKFYTDVRYEEITKEGLVITDKDGDRQILAADTVITALPMLTNTSLFDSLKGAAAEIYAVGDCNPTTINEEYPRLICFHNPYTRTWPAYTVNAVRTAHHVAREI